MILKRVLYAACAAVVAASSLAFGASAEEEARPVIPFTYEESMISTDAKTPALSFDNDNWSKYVHTNDDADLIGLTLTQDKTTYSQGFSLKASASKSTDALLYNMQYITDDDGNYVYEASTAEGAELKVPAIELRSEDFGLSCFDGCFFTFQYKIGADAEGKLLQNSVYCYGTDDTYTAVLTPKTLQLTYDVLTNDNVTQYRKQAISVRTEMACTRFVFELPVMEDMSSDVLCLDNISIKLPVKDESGNDLYIKALDGYNASAKAQEKIEEIQIKEKSSGVEVGDAPEKQEGGNGFVVVIIIIVVVGIAGAGIFFFIKKKKAFY